MEFHKLVEAICRMKNGHVIQLLQKMDVATINRTDWTGRTPLHYACSYNNSEALEYLLKVPHIDTDEDSDGWTPIMEAAYRCHEDVLKLMLDDPRVDIDSRSRVNLSDQDLGLEELVDWQSQFSASKKNACLTMIRDAKIKRELSKHGEELEDVRVKVRTQYIEKIQEMNKKMEYREASIKKNWDLKTSRMDDLKKKQNEEKKCLIEKHQNERTKLEEECKHKTEEDQHILDGMKKVTDKLAEDLKKFDMEPDEDSQGKLKAARDTLECPVCLTLMKPPTRIWMCPSSHAVCELCKFRLKENMCPTCRIEHVTLRAFFAENLARSIFN